MRIRGLTLHNFGVYAGTNTFEFVENKPIVLIGGLNGRGKTTFLEAVVLALYGSNSFCFRESIFRSYSKYLCSYINRLDGSNETFIEIEFDLNEFETYKVKRFWNSNERKIEEKVKVEKNGEFNQFLTDNWPMFIENQIPSALSSFYFFDGEKISELAIDQSDESVKQSVKTMLGMTVLETLRSDLEKINKKIMKLKKENTTVKILDELKEEKQSIENDLSDLNKQLVKLEEKIEEYNIKIKDLQVFSETKGGEILKENQNFIEKRSEVISDIEKQKDILVELSSSALPLLLVKDLLEDIKLTAVDEHNDLIMNEAVEQIDFLLEDYLEIKGEDDSSRGFVQYIKSIYEGEQDNVIYNLSDHALFQINDLLEIRFKSLQTDVLYRIKQKDKLLNLKDNLDNYLSIDINEKEIQELYNQIIKYENKRNKIQLEIEILKKEIEEKNTLLKKVKYQYEKNVEEYLKNEELNDDNERKIKYLNISLNILQKYSSRLQKDKIKKLSETITDCYKKLANKKTLIKVIEMDPINLDISYISYEGNIIEKESLSSGEKQLMVLSILWALAICSKKVLPVIIDTPLSRLDSKHRTTIVKTYFPQASEQTIILSTDTEIDGYYYKLIKDKVGDEYTLIYDEITKSTSIKKGYYLGGNYDSETN